MKRAPILLFSTVLVLGCDGSTPEASPNADESAAPATQAETPSVHEAPEEATHEEGHAAHEGQAEAAPAGETPRQFGEALSERNVTPLAQIVAAPGDFAGQTVKTEGEITQVCQRMGCWMEMRAEGGPAIRVPMAGHSFFLPRDVAGSQVTIEGEVAVRELSDDEREHLASEGAQAVASALQITATGVVLGES
ncbi:MAG: DUF4920 domain-containing protein [Myxococcota bacterium]